MRLVPCVGAVLMGAAVSAGGLVSWRLWCAPRSEARAADAPAPGAQEGEGRAEERRAGSEDGSLEEGAEGRVLFGFVQARSLDPRRWSVVATPLSLSAAAAVRSAELNSRGRFELAGLADMDYCVELVAEGTPPRVLARADFVRPGGDELVLELDPLELAQLADAAPASE